MPLELNLVLERVFSTAFLAAALIVPAKSSTRGIGSPKMSVAPISLRSWILASSSEARLFR